MARPRPPEDLGDGYVVQHLRDGNGCYSEVFVILPNCDSGEAVAFGGHMGPMDPGPVEVLESLTEYESEGGPEPFCEPCS